MLFHRLAGIALVAIFGVVLLDGADAAKQGDTKPVKAASPSRAPAISNCDAGRGRDCQVKQDDVDNPGYERGVLLVKFRAQTAQLLRASGGQTAKSSPASLSVPSSLRGFFAKYRVTSIEPLFPDATTSPAYVERIRARYPVRTARGRPARDAARIDDIFKLTLDRQADLERASRELNADAQVIFAEPNRWFKLFVTPNDQYYNTANLWGLFKVQAGTAWNTATGLGVTVAVVDTGVDPTHTDLQANLWTNPNETLDGLDNDGDLLVDDVGGWDFAHNDNAPTDPIGHGTHVAGTVAAVGNNTNGVVGLAYQSKLMRIKGFYDWGGGVGTALVAGMKYAADHGADVINNSWGGPDSATVRNMVDYAYGLGVVVVSAAGNANIEACEVSPGNAENGITVSASTNVDARASYSNFGVKIDVAAPGGANTVPSTLMPATDILSTIPTTSTLTSAGFPVSTGGDGKKYIPLSGTSMAAPHVSALAALLIQAHPTWTVEQIRQAITRSADDISTAGFDKDSGHGRINAATALAATTARPSASIQTPGNCNTITGTVSVAGVASVASGAGNYVVDVGAGDVPTSFTQIATAATPAPAVIASFNSHTVADGRHTIRVTTTDSFGKKGEDRNLVLVDNVFIATPTDSQILTGVTAPVTGKAAGTLGFTNYILDWASGCNATSGFTTITNSTTQVATVGALGTWNLSSVPDGKVTLRLRANFTGNGGFTSSDQKCVVIDKFLSPGWPVAINQVPTFKSPKIADLQQNGTNQIVLGATVLEASGAVRTGWNNFPGLGRTNSVVLNVDTSADLEVVAAVFDGISTSPNSGAPVIYAYKHNKSVVWSRVVQNPNTTLTTSNHGTPSSLSAADVDGDGKLDIVFTMFFSYFNPNTETQVFVLDATTGAVKKNFPIPGLSQSSVALANIDGVGPPELIMQSYVPPNSARVLVSKWDGTSLAGWPVTITDIEGFGNIDPVVADLDMNGVPEILVGKHLFKPNGTESTGWPFGSISRSTGALAPMPDADCEMEAVGGGGNSIVFALNQHNAVGSFIKSHTNENTLIWMMGENGNQGNPVIADVDGDGLVEIVRSAEYGISPGSQPISLYGSEASSSASPASFPRFVLNANPSGWTDPIRSTAAVGDLDNNGKTDLVIAAGGQVYRWDLNTTFNANLNHWPMFQRDLRSTGFLPSSSPVTLDAGMMSASNTFARRITLAQTFTPTKTGKLTLIKHGLQGLSGSVANYDLLVTTTTGGLPSWTSGSYSVPNVLYSAAGLTVFSTSGIVNGAVTIPAGQRPLLAAGTTYAFILIPKNPTTGLMYWRGNSGAGTYVNGSAYQLNGASWTVPTTGPRDHGFALEGCL